MTPTLALIWLLAACPFFDPQVPVRVLEPVAYAEAAPPNLKRSLGFASWSPGLTDCRITLRAPTTAATACHEYRHCAQGHFHE